MRSFSKTVEAALAIALLCGCPFIGAEDAPRPAPAAEVLSAEDRARVAELFEALKQAFMARDAGAAARLFIARTGDEQLRLETIAANIRRELRKEGYVQPNGFEILELTPDARLSPARVNVWARLAYRMVDKQGLPPRRGQHNDFFVLERLPDGAFALVDSPYFDTLGQRQGLNLVADALLGLIGILAALSFWVWMGFEAFRLRPRSHAWRVLVMLPLLGALIFFVAAYLPRLKRGPAETGA